MLNQKISRRSFMTVSAMTAAALALDWKKITAYAAKMGPKKDYPVVIIGAGLGGLCCGAYLAKQGIPVTGIRSFVNEMVGIAEEANRLHEKGGKFFKLLFPIQYRKM